jgi:septal ring factor EnvC (AmiA/AmiB activator)
MADDDTAPLNLTERAAALREELAKVEQAEQEAQEAEERRRAEKAARKAARAARRAEKQKAAEMPEVPETAEMGEGSAETGMEVDRGAENVDKGTCFPCLRRKVVCEWPR